MIEYFERKLLISLIVGGFVKELVIFVNEWRCDYDGLGHAFFNAFVNK